jgi:hypothetical protein
LLEPLLKIRRLHFTEFAALCAAEVQVALAEGNQEAARGWLGLWERGYPDHPQLPILRDRVRKRGWWSRLLGRRS